MLIGKRGEVRGESRENVAKEVEVAMASDCRKRERGRGDRRRRRCVEWVIS